TGPPSPTEGCGSGNASHSANPSAEGRETPDRAPAPSASGPGRAHRPAGVAARGGRNLPLLAGHRPVQLPDLALVLLEHRQRLPGEPLHGCARVLLLDVILEQVDGLVVRGHLHLDV